MNELEQVKFKISRIDSKVKVITERPFRSEEDEESRYIAVNKLMDERDELVKERIRLEREENKPGTSYIKDNTLIINMKD